MWTGHRGTGQRGGISVTSIVRADDTGSWGEDVDDSAIVGAGGGGAPVAAGVVAVGGGDGDDS